MTAGSLLPAWVETLPEVRGRYSYEAPLHHLVWFRVGGAADVLFKPADIEDLAFFMKHCPSHVPITVIGVGSNLLIRDGGVPGVVIKLTKGFQYIREEEDLMIAGAGALDRTVALEAAQSGWGGLEFLVGIPGTVGGAVYMNAGAYEREVKDILVWIRVVTDQGDIKTLYASDIPFSYRSSGLPPRWFVVEAAFKGEKESPELIQKKIEEILKRREETQPVRARTGGSTFKNPPEQSAWKLIDAAGCRGLVKGGAQVSEKHCNFLLNTGTAKAEDLESLGEIVQNRVRETSGVLLEWEIKRIGRKQ